MFSRDQITQENIIIEDDAVATKVMKKREQDNHYTAKSKASVQKEVLKPKGGMSTWLSAQT